MREASHFTSTLQILIGVVIVASILFVTFTQTSKPLDAEHLKLIVSELRSTASEGKLLSEQDFRNSLREKYLKSQLELMQQNLRKQIDQLKNPDVKQNIAQQQAQALKLADELQDGLQRIPDSGRTMGLEFRALFDQLLALESQLEKMS